MEVSNSNPARKKSSNQDTQNYHLPAVPRSSSKPKTLHQERVQSSRVQSKQKPTDERRKKQQFTVREMVLETQLQADKKMRRALQPYLSSLPQNTPTIGSGPSSPLLLRLKEVSIGKSKNSMLASMEELGLDFSDLKLNSKYDKYGSNYISKSQQDLLNTDCEKSFGNSDAPDQYEVVFLNKSSPMDLVQTDIEPTILATREREQSKPSLKKGGHLSSTYDAQDHPYQRERSESKNLASALDTPIKAEARSTRVLNMIAKRIEKKGNDPQSKPNSQLSNPTPKAINFHLRRPANPAAETPTVLPQVKSPRRHLKSDIERAKSINENASRVYRMWDESSPEHSKKSIDQAQKPQSKAVRRKRKIPKPIKGASSSPKQGKRAVEPTKRSVVLPPIQSYPRKDSQPAQQEQMSMLGHQYDSVQNATSDNQSTIQDRHSSHRQKHKQISIMNNQTDENMVLDTSMNSPTLIQNQYNRQNTKSWIESSPTAVTKQPAPKKQQRVSIRSTERGKQDSESLSTNMVLTAKPTKELMSELNLANNSKKPTQSTQREQGPIQITEIHTNPSSSPATGRSLPGNSAGNTAFSQHRVNPLLYRVGTHLQNLQHGMQPRQLGVGKRSLLVTNTGRPENVQMKKGEVLPVIAFTTREDRKSSASITSEQEQVQQIRTVATNLVSSLPDPALEQALLQADREDADQFVGLLFDDADLADEFTEGLLDSVIEEAEQQPEKLLRPQMPPLIPSIEVQKSVPLPKPNTAKVPIKPAPRSTIPEPRNIVVSVLKSEDTGSLPNKYPPVPESKPTNPTLSVAPKPSTTNAKPAAPVEVKPQTSSPIANQMASAPPRRPAPPSRALPVPFDPSDIDNQCTDEFVVQLQQWCIEEDLKPQTTIWTPNLVTNPSPKQQLPLSPTTSAAQPPFDSSEIDHLCTTEYIQQLEQWCLDEDLKSVVEQIQQEPKKILPIRRLIPKAAETQVVPAVVPILLSKSESPRTVEQSSENELVDDADEYVAALDDWVATQLAIRDTLAEAKGNPLSSTKQVSQSAATDTRQVTYPEKVSIAPCRIVLEYFSTQPRRLESSSNGRISSDKGRSPFNRQNTKSRKELLKEGNYGIRLKLSPCEKLSSVHKRPQPKVPQAKCQPVPKDTRCQLGEYYGGTGLSFFSSYISRSKKSKLYSARSGKRVQAAETVIKDLPSPADTNPWTSKASTDTIPGQRFSQAGKHLAALGTMSGQIHLAAPDDVGSFGKNPRSILRGKNTMNSGSRMGSLSSSQVNVTPVDVKQSRGLAAESGTISSHSYAQAYEREILFLKQQGDKRAEEIYKERNHLFKSQLNSIASSAVDGFFRQTPNSSYEKSEFEMDFKPPRKIKGFDPSKHEYVNEDNMDAKGENNLRRKAANVGMSAIANFKGFDGVKNKFENANDPFSQFKMIRLGNGPYDFLIQDFEAEDDFQTLVMGDEKAVKTWCEDTVKVMRKKVKPAGAPLGKKGLVVEPVPVTKRSSVEVGNFKKAKKASSRLSDDSDSASTQNKIPSRNRSKEQLLKRTMTKPIDDDESADLSDKDGSDGSSSDKKQRKGGLIINNKTKQNRKPSKSADKSEEESGSDEEKSSSKSEDESGSDASDEEEDDSSSSEQEEEAEESGSGQKNTSKATEKEKALFVVHKIQMHWDTTGIKGVQASYTHQNQTVEGTMHGSACQETASLDILAGDRCYEIWTEIGDNIIKCLKFVLGRGDTVRLGPDEYDSRTRVYNYSIKRRKLSRVHAGFSADGYLVCLAFKLVKSRL